MPNTPRHFVSPPAPMSESCLTAYSILCKAVDAAESFHVIFRELRTAAGAGTSTDAQQDTLRAMLVFACAGLDSCLKQLVRDALPQVLERDTGAQQSFTDSVKRKLPDIERSRDLLAGVLTSLEPRKFLIDRVMSDLLAESLQSVPQFSRVAAAFDIRSSVLVAGLKEAFDARNQIIHEMDINFGSNRSRRPRARAEMERLTKLILDASAALLDRVDQKLR